MSQTVSYWMRPLGLTALISGSKRLNSARGYWPVIGPLVLRRSPCAFLPYRNVLPTGSSGFVMLGSR
jgi:hypothetical protein